MKDLHYLVDTLWHSGFILFQSSEEHAAILYHLIPTCGQSGAEAYPANTGQRQGTTWISQQCTTDTVQRATTHSHSHRWAV